MAILKRSRSNDGEPLGNDEIAEVSKIMEAQINSFQATQNSLNKEMDELKSTMLAQLSQIQSIRSSAVPLQSTYGVQVLVCQPGEDIYGKVSSHALNQGGTTFVLSGSGTAFWAGSVGDGRPLIASMSGSFDASGNGNMASLVYTKAGAKSAKVLRDKCTADSIVYVYVVTVPAAAAAAADGLDTAADAGAGLKDIPAAM